MKLIQKSSDVKTSLYTIIILLIYSSRETFVLGDSGNDSLKIIGYAMTLIATLLLFLYRIRLGRSSSVTKYVFIFSFLSLLTLVFNFDVSIKYFYEILLFVICSYIVVLLPFSKFKLVFTDIVYWLSVFSVGVYAFFLIAPSVVEIFPIVINGNGLEKYFLGFSVIGPEPYSIPRNYGIFREPGVFVIYLCVALLFELFSESRKYIKIFVFSLALLTTFSTAGYLVALLIIASFLLFGKKIKSGTKILIISSLILLFSIIIVSFADYSLLDFVFGKLSYENDSTNSRVGSIAVNMYAFTRNVISILFGNGYTFMESSFETLSDIVKAGGHNTNTVLRLFAVHGVFYGLMFLGYLYKFCKKYCKPVSLCSLIILLLLFSNEELMTSFLLYILPFYGMITSPK